jgi:hypothetical protein
MLSSCCCEVDAAGRASIKRLQLRTIVRNLGILTKLQFLMDYTEGSLFTILIVALITGSKYTTIQYQAFTCLSNTRHQECARPLLP